MPDDIDFAWLAQFLQHPESWSEEDLATAHSLLRYQERALLDADPRDHATRQRLRGVVDALERAIALRFR